MSGKLWRRTPDQICRKFRTVDKASGIVAENRGESSGKEEKILPDYQRTLDGTITRIEICPPSEKDGRRPAGLKDSRTKNRPAVSIAAGQPGRPVGHCQRRQEA